MAVIYSDFISLVEDDINSDKEIELRNSISRFYYGAYHSSKSVGDELPEFADVIGGMHSKYISRFKEHASKDYKKIGFMLDWMHRQRCNADYKLDLDITKEDAASQLMYVNKVIDSLSKL